MSEISEKAKELLESTVKNAIAYGQEKGNPFGLVSTYEAMFRLDKSDLEHYIATLEAENRALRHSLELRECEEMEHKPEITAINSEQDYKSALAEVSRLMNAEPGSEDEARLVRLATLVEAYEDARYPIQDESDLLKGVPFVSLSNAEIAAMTPEHPLYKLVHGEGGEG